jgi:hypothetical protein
LAQKPSIFKTALIFRMMPAAAMVLSGMSLGTTLSCVDAGVGADGGAAQDCCVGADTGTLFDEGGDDF